MVADGIVALGVPLTSEGVMLAVTDIVGVLVGVLVAVEVEAVVGVTVEVVVEADFAESVLACKPMPIKTPRNSSTGTMINTRARCRRLRRGAVATAAAASTVRSVVRVVSTR